MLTGSNFVSPVKRFMSMLLLFGYLGIQPLLAQQLTHGPIVGGVTSSSAHFYLRVDASATVTIQLATTKDFADRVSGVNATASAENDFTVLLRMNGLLTDTLYYYRAVVNGVPAGEVRQFRTFPAPGSRNSFTFTFGSCQQNQPWQSSPAAGRVFTVMARDLPRFFLQIGDWGYPDTTDSVRDSTNFFSVDMGRVQASYRAKFDSTYPLQQVLRIAPVDYVYDDHDYVNDNASAFTASDAVRAREIPIPAQARLNSILGYQQLFPGYPLPNSNGGVWHKFTYGNADFFMLDTRSQRSPNMNALRFNSTMNKYEFAPPASHSILAGDSTLIGENQRDWLLRELLASTADWKFIITSVPFNRGLRQALDLTLALQDSAVTIPGFGSVTGLFVAIELLDKWVGFPHDQEMLLQFLRDHQIKNVILLSGDLHTAAIDDGTNAGLPELMAGGLDITNSRIVALLQFFGISIWNRGGQTLMSSSFDDAYGRITVFGADSARLEIVDEFGKVLATHTVLDGSVPTSVSNEPIRPIARFSLSLNYPNPLRPAAFESQTSVRYSLPNRALVSATIYDVLGRAVRRWQPQWQNPGEHLWRWEGKDERGQVLRSGIYFVSIHVAFANGHQQTATQKIALIK